MVSGLEIRARALDREFRFAACVWRRWGKKLMNYLQWEKVAISTDGTSRSCLASRALQALMDEKER